MKKYALLVLLLASVACADVSQEQAGITCNPYSLEGETIQVTGPLTCEKSYWICEFNYFGNLQKVLIAVSTTEGSVIAPDSDVFEDVASTKYATESGSSILSTFLTDSSFIIQMRAMNATLQNYEGILESLMDEEYIDRPTFIEFRDRMVQIKRVAFEVADGSEDLYNKSEEFWDSPNCIELIEYLDGLGSTLTLAENFSASWIDFIARYNALAASVDVYVATVNPSDAQILSQSVAAVRSMLDNYNTEEQDYVKTVGENLETRFERKRTKDDLDKAYELVKNTKNPEATTKYNDAQIAFSNGEYSRARSLANEAIALAPIVPETNGGPTVIVKEAPDYTPYFIVVVVLLVTILVVTLLKRRGGGEEEEKPKKKKRGLEWSR